MRNTLTALFRLQRGPGDQRERHDQRRRDQVRRQRPARRDGRQPAPGPPHGDPQRRRWPLPVRSGRPRAIGEVIPLVSRTSTSRRSRAWRATAGAAGGTGGMRSKLQAARPGHPGRGLGRSSPRAEEARAIARLGSWRGRPSAPSSWPEGPDPGGQEAVDRPDRAAPGLISSSTPGARRGARDGGQEPPGDRRSSTSSANSRRGTSSE